MREAEKLLSHCELRLKPSHRCRADDPVELGFGFGAVLQRFCLLLRALRQPISCLRLALGCGHQGVKLLQSYLTEVCVTPRRTGQRLVFLCELFIAAVACRSGQLCVPLLQCIRLGACGLKCSDGCIDLLHLLCIRRPACFLQFVK